MNLCTYMCVCVYALAYLGSLLVQSHSRHDLFNLNKPKLSENITKSTFHKIQNLPNCFLVTQLCVCNACVYVYRNVCITLVSK